VFYLKIRIKKGIKINPQSGFSIILPHITPYELQELVDAQ